MLGELVIPGSGFINDRFFARRKIQEWGLLKSTKLFPFFHGKLSLWHAPKMRLLWRDGLAPIQCLSPSKLPKELVNGMVPQIFTKQENHLEFRCTCASRDSSAVNNENPTLL